jgi:hypothetical protein
MRRQDDDGKDQGRDVRGIDPEKTPGKKTFPPLSLSLEREMDAKSADDKKYRDADLAETERQKEDEAVIEGKIPYPPVPRQRPFPIDRAECVIKQDRQDREAPRMVEEDDMPGRRFVWLVRFLGHKTRRLKSAKKNGRSDRI